MVGSSLMAFSKTCGRSNAPGGWWCLLGLPWGVCCGLMKASVGVPGRSIALSRVCSGGGGAGSWKLSLLPSSMMGYWAIGQEGAVDGQQRIAAGDRQASAKKQKASNVGAGNRRLWFYNATLYTPS
jgi:hypothetical protein